MAFRLTYRRQCRYNTKSNKQRPGCDEETGPKKNAGSMVLMWPEKSHEELL